MSRKTLRDCGLVAVIATVAACGSHADSRVEPATTGSAQAGPGGEQAGLDVLAEAAIGDDARAAAAATTALRAAGPSGLDALLSAHAPLVARIGTGDARAERLHRVIDRVAAQRDAHASRLFWHTSLDDAKLAAHREGRPILSLRLLGRLDEEVSCANSRFFRTILYPNARVSAYLRDHWVLHWSSERPVPRITIDFGDGRRMERTITGNSIHYVLDAKGRPVDGIPGLYSPGDFLRTLGAVEPVAKNAAQLDTASFVSALRTFHTAQLAVADMLWRADLVAVGVAPSVVQMTSPPSPPPGALAGAGDAAGNRLADAPTAEAAVPIAMGKMLVEAPMLRALGRDVGTLAQPVDDATWTTIVARHRSAARVDAPSRALITAKIRDTVDARTGRPVRLDDAEVARRVDEFERVLAEDSLRNEQTNHRVIHQWLARGALSFSDLDERVYSQLFLTPRSDPWLGLLGTSSFTALDNDGLQAGNRAR